MYDIHTEEEINNTIYVSSLIEDYNILQKPCLPPFDCPNGQNPDEYLRQLCRNGWREKILNIIPVEHHDEYTNRIKYELEILQQAGLSSYFLIVEDIVKYIKGKMATWARKRVSSRMSCFIFIGNNINRSNKI